MAETKLPLIISIGIGRPEILEMIDIIRNTDNFKHLTFLYCVSSYPTKFEDIGLLSLQDFQEANKLEDYSSGLSDHTEGILLPPIAVSMGATCIEKHFRLEGYEYFPDSSSPDYDFSISPLEFSKMTENIRLVESAMAFIEDAILDCEKETEKHMRSIIASTDLTPGTILSKNNIMTKRGISTYHEIKALAFLTGIGKEDVLNQIHQALSA